MSCEVHLTACIQDVSNIKQCLFSNDDYRGGDNWLQSSKISASPIGDRIVIANDRRVVILGSKWNATTNSSQFHIIYSDTIHDCDRVKAVLCLPVVGQTHSSHVRSDWTCILIGYDSGFVRFYTEIGEFLLEEQFHNENIINVKCQSQHSPRPDICPELYPEEIYIQYQSNVCVVNGAQLFTNLRNCRSHLAKESEYQQIPLHVKKWGFQDQNVINDVAVVGLNLSSTFDHLMTASNCGGFDSKYRSTAPNSTLVLAAGSKPFLGYHYALEGANQPILSDVAKAVANKLKSALPNWLTGNKPQIEKEITIANQSVDQMGCRFGLCDLQRTGSEIILSPNRRLVAVSDALGRVILVDSFRGVAVKVFKGYREAQCAFLQVPDERKSKHRLGNKVAHFLIIYAPKKGTLEIFTVQQGTRIATFSASKFSRLLYITHGLMGFTTTSKSRYVCQFTCVFIDNDGQIKEFLVPFHFALAEKNSKSARDIHLYKKLRQMVKSSNESDLKLRDDALKIYSEIKTVEIKTQTLEMLLSSRQVNADFLMDCVSYFLEKCQEAEENEANFKNFCSNLKSLLDLYLFVHSDTDNTEGETDNNAEELEIDGLEKLQKLLDLATVNHNENLKKAHVTFSDDIKWGVSDFLSSFNLSKVELKPNLDCCQLFKTAELLFMSYITGISNDFDELNEKLLQSKIPIKNLFDMIICYWVNRSLDINQSLKQDMNNFFLLITALVRCGDNGSITAISPFWSDIRDVLANSSRPFPALMAAILCKNVAHKHDSEVSEAENIEVLSEENIEWSLLIGKLEDVSMLNIILSNKSQIKNSVLPKLKHQNTEISLKHILDGGKGSVTECVAQWLTSGGLDPECILINEIIYKNTNLKDNNSENLEINEGMNLEKISQVKSEPVFEYLNLLKAQFPYSLESSTLLANMCWEYALAWRSNIVDMANLESAMTCLNFITNLTIKQGLHQLLWNTHLKIIVESVCKLINKVGRLPKERLCQQDTGLTDKQVSNFVGICTEFLESFTEVAQASSDCQKSELKFEAIWENGGNQPLVQLACLQKDVDYNLLYLHYQLALVLQMITTFSVKHSKPVNNLFEASIANLFFTDLQRKVDINWNKSDIKINSSRTQFLCKIISASLETVTVDESNKIYCKDHVDWMAKCVTLARIWSLDIDALKRFQIVQLYVNGFDQVAEELVSAINETNELGVELLAVCGKRLSQFLTSSPDLSKNITALSPALSRYLESLNGDWCSPSSLPVIENLATKILQCLNESDKEYKHAELLAEACSTLEEINS